MNLFQEDSAFLPEIRKSGCYLLSLHFHIATLKEVLFTYEDINKYYYKFLGSGYILQNCYILNPDKIFSFFGIITEVRKELASYLTRTNELEISRVEVKGINEGHFVVSKNNTLIYDSMRYKEKNKQIKFVSKRIFRLLGGLYA